MTHAFRTRSGLRRIAATTAVAAGLVTATLLPLPGRADAAGAAGAARVSVSPRVPTTGHATTLQLSGAGFQSVKNGFGGVYILFGVVRGAWRPSQGGASGLNYLYVPDSERKNNHGYQRFVAYPGDSTAAAANGGTLAKDGTWHTDLVVPGSTFRVQGRNGTPLSVNCRVEQCGVITIGAHGVVSSHNETFTPVSFALPATSRRTRHTTPITAVTPTRARATPRPKTSAAAQPRSSTPKAASSASTASTQVATSTGSQGGRDAATATSPSASPAAASRTDSSAGSNAALVTVVVLAIAAVLAFGARFWWRRHRTQP